MMVSCLVVAYCFNNLSYSIIKIVRIISLVHKTLLIKYDEFIHIFTMHYTPLASIQLKSIYQQLVSQLLLAAPVFETICRGILELCTQFKLTSQDVTQRAALSRRWQQSTRLRHSINHLPLIMHKGIQWVGGYCSVTT